MVLFNFFRDHKESSTKDKNDYSSTANSWRDRIRKESGTNEKENENLSKASTGTRTSWKRQESKKEEPQPPVSSPTMLSSAPDDESEGKFKSKLPKDEGSWISQKSVTEANKKSSVPWVSEPSTVSQWMLIVHFLRRIVRWCEQVHI